MGWLTEKPHVCSKPALGHRSLWADRIHHVWRCDECYDQYLLDASGTWIKLSMYDDEWVTVPENTV